MEKNENNDVIIAAINKEFEKAELRNMKAYMSGGQVKISYSIGGFPVSSVSFNDADKALDYAISECVEARAARLAQKKTKMVDVVV